MLNQSTEILRKLTLPEMADIYEAHMKEAFPADELKPMKRIEDMYRAGMYFGYGLFEEDEAGNETLLAYGYFVEHKPTHDLLLDYLAVPNGLRGQGSGSRFLSHLPEMTKGAHVLLFEIEHPEKTDDPNARALRESRQRFYLRNGVQRTTVESRAFGVEYRILQYRDGAPLTDREVSDALDTVYHAMFPERWFSTNVIIYPLN